MDVKVWSGEEVRAFDKARLREAEHELRKQIMDSRMEFFTQAKSAGYRRTLRRNLARVLTVRGEGNGAAAKR